MVGIRSAPNPAIPPELGWVWEGAVGQSRQLSGEGHVPEVADVECGLPCLGLAKFSKVNGRDRLVALDTGGSASRLGVDTKTYK